MHGNSSVGTSAVYEAGDQRNVKNSEVPHAERYEEGKVNSHDTHDSSKYNPAPPPPPVPGHHFNSAVILTQLEEDQRSLANRLAAEEHKSEPHDDRETAMSKKDSTLPAKMHGNEPSKGAKIDQELENEEQELLKKRGGGGMPGKKM